MRTGRSSLPGVFAPVLVAFLTIGFLSGCGGGGGTDPNDPGTTDNEPVHTTLLDQEDRDLLAAAAMQYVTAVQTQEPAAARAELVQALNATDGIAAANLFEDGFTIYAETDRGGRAVLNTLDLDAVNTDPSRALGGAPVASADDPGKGGFSSDAHAPTSRRVLILVPNSPDMPYADETAQALVSYFTLAGWDADDIDLKIRTTRTSTAITPDDLMDFDEYGVVILFAHALYGAPGGGSPHLYVQACSAVDYAHVATPQRSAAWNEMIQEGTILTGGTTAAGDECFYLRADRFASRSIALPATLFYLIVPFSDRLALGLDERGAGSVLSWDNVFVAADAYAGVRYFFQAMAGSPTPYDGEVYARTAQPKASSNPEDGSPAALDLLFASSQLYLPAWAAVHFTGLPTGTTNAGIGVNYLVTMDGGVARPSISLGTGTDGELAPLVPIEIVIEGSAVDSDGNTIAAVQYNQQLSAGLNSLTVDFSRQHVPGLATRFDWDMGDGRLWTQFFLGFVYDKNPSSNRYKVFTDYWPDGYLVYQPLVYSGEYLYIRGDYCYDHEQLLYIWGADPFDVTAGHVVYVEPGSSWGNYLPDATTLDSETGQIMTWRAIIDREWAEYLAREGDARLDVIFQ